MSQHQDPNKKKGETHFNLQKAFIDDDDDEDQTIIQLSSNIIHINYFQLCKYSKLIRKEYDQNDFKEHLLSDIQRFQKEYEIKEENMVTFFKIFQEENFEIRNDQYLDLFLLSELFKVGSLKNILKEYSENHLNDVDFIINLIRSEPKASKIHDLFPSGEYFVQLEQCLTRNVNQCIQNENFAQLPISTIYRIIEKCDRTKLQCDLLYDFIAKSIDTRYYLFSFLDIENMSDNKFDDLFKGYIARKNSPSNAYYKFLPIDLMTIKIARQNVYVELNKMQSKYQKEIKIYTQIIKEFYSQGLVNRKNPIKIDKVNFFFKQINISICM